MKLLFFVIACSLSYSTWACLESQEASFLFVPDPMWIFDSPEVNEATVKAKIAIDASGRVKIKKIIEVTPKDLPLRQLKEAIENARFIPAKYKTSTSDTWIAVNTTIEYEFELTW